MELMEIHINFKIIWRMQHTIFDTRFRPRIMHKQLLTITVVIFCPRHPLKSRRALKDDWGGGASGRGSLTKDAYRLYDPRIHQLLRSSAVLTDAYPPRWLHLGPFRPLCRIVTWLSAMRALLGEEQWSRWMEGTVNWNFSFELAWERIYPILPTECPSNLFNDPPLP